MNVVLTGFMGAGKSTVGRHLARLLGVAFIDTDDEIEKAHGRIAAIFRREGEAKFREYERDHLARAVARGPAVIAVGGGAVLDPGNRELIRRDGVIVHLAISAQAAHERIVRRTHRPLLGTLSTVEAVRTLMAARAQAYADNDLALDVDGLEAGGLAQTIAHWYWTGPAARAAGG
jgi:shikimate kinase